MTHRTWPLYGAALWSAAYAVVSAGWLIGLGGYPFEPSGGEGTNLLDGLPQPVGATVLLLLALAGTAVVTAIARRSPAAWPWPTAAVLAALLLVVVPDYRVVMTVAYLPIILVTTIAGNDDSAVWAAVTSWPLLNLVLLSLAGACFALAAVDHRRHVARRCAGCGRATDPARAADPRALRRWGRIGVTVAVVIPVGYAVTRLAWFAGFPLGLSDTTYAAIQELGILGNGAALGSMAVAGAVLTLGLVQGWGEVFPRWIPFLRGKRVPINVAVVPALVVGVMVTSAGLMFIRLALTGSVTGAFAFMTMGDWSAWLPELLWPLWGAGLWVAAAAYRARRLPPCRHQPAVSAPAGPSRAA